MMLPSVLGLLSGYQLQNPARRAAEAADGYFSGGTTESRLLSPENLDKIAKARDYSAPAAGRMVYLDNRDGNRLARNGEPSATVAAR